MPTTKFGTIIHIQDLVREVPGDCPESAYSFPMTVERAAFPLPNKSGVTGSPEVTSIIRHQLAQFLDTALTAVT